MAIYKPNNFYPYMQEVDLESLDGVTFSCQVNTDGNSMIRAARLRILDKDNNIVLYENIQNLKIPVQNGEIVEFQVEPFYLSSGNINFISLTPNVDIDKRITYCPYNLYQSQLYNNDYFKIIQVSYDENNNVIYNEVREYNVNMENDNYLLSFTEDTSLSYYTVLKNNNDYVWNIELFEHTIDTSEYDGTLMGESKIVGSIESVVWVNKRNQTNESLIDLDNLKDENDLYIDTEFTEDNSNFYKQDILKGYSTKGSISLKEDDANDIQNIMIGNFVFKQKSQADNYNNGIYSKNVYNYDVYFGDFYENTTYGRKIKLEDPKNYIKINLDISKHSSILEGVGNLKSQYIYHASYENKQWHYLNNVEVEVIQESEEKVFKFHNLENATIGDICYRIFKYQKDDGSIAAIDLKNNNAQKTKFVNLYKNLTDNTNYVDYPFACKDAQTYIVCTSEEAQDEDKKEWIKAINGSNGMYGYDGEIVAVIKDTTYRLKVLNPRPMDMFSNRGGSGFYKINEFEKRSRFYSGCDVDHFRVGIELQDGCISYNKDSLTEEKIIKTDIECFGSNQNFNAVEDIFYKKAGLFFYHTQSNTFYMDEETVISQLDEYLIDEENYKIKINCIPDYFLMNVKGDTIYDFFYHLYNTENKNNIQFDILLMDENLKNSINLDYSLNENNGYNLSIPYFYNNGFIKIIPKWTSIYDKFQIVSLNLLQDIDSTNILKLSENSIDFSKEEDIYIDIVLINNMDSQETLYPNLKVVKFYNINKQFYLEDTLIQRKIYDFLKFQNYSATYKIKKLIREKVSNISKNLGMENNFMKFETTDVLPYYLYDSQAMKLYTTSNETTPNSFFGVCDSDLNVEYLYVRFPNYDGLDSNNNQITKQPYILSEDGTTLPTEYYSAKLDGSSYIIDKVLGHKGDPGCNGVFFNPDIYITSDGRWDKDEVIKPNVNTIQPLSIYGTNVPKDVFEKKTDHYYKLFKVTSYNYETGEIIIAGGLNRNISISDEYELWEGHIIEGSSNEYDITEVITSYTRIYPKNSDVYTKVISNGEIFCDNIKIANTSETNLFITPHSNFKFPEYNNSYLCIDDKRIYLPGSFILEKYGYKDSSIDKLDNSQWLINMQGNGSRDYIEKYCSLYQDVVSSEYNYFYGRKTEELKLYSIPIETFDANNLEDVEIQDNLFDNKIDGEYIIINNLDFYIYGIYSHSDPLKRYYIKIYDQDMNIVYDSTYIYDSKILYRIKGLNNNSIYYITIECENQLGNIVIYEQLLKVQYLEEIEESIKLKIENNCEQSAVSVTFLNAEDNSYCSFEDFLNKNIRIKETDSIRIYRKNQYGNIKWLTDINLQNDRFFYSQDGNIQSKYSFTDYNVGSNEKYEYIAVLDSVKSSDSKTYNVIKDSIVTNFNVWSIADIVQSDEDENLYSVVSDIWSFSYNLESEGLTQNTSTTTWDTLGRYGQVGKGEKNFISSGLKCLLGDVGYYQTYNNEGQLIKKYGYNEKDISSPEQVPINNITKYKKWTKFCNSFSKKLLKDLKGNKWIVQIVDNPSVTNDDKSHAQLYTIAFSWHEIMDSDDISVVNKSLDNEISSEFYDYYGEKDIFPSSVDLFKFEENDSEDGTKTVSLESYKGNLSTIVIPYVYNGYAVTSINNDNFPGKFSMEENLTNIIIPNTVTRIGDWTFASCDITNITIPKSVTNIGNFVFSGSDKLISVNILGNIKNIGVSTFESCDKLISVKMPNSVQSIGDYAFYNCIGLTSIKIPLEVVTIGERAFYNCSSLTSITISHGIINIGVGQDVFLNCDNLTDIGNYAFYNCSGLTSITIPNSVTRIGEGAFDGCENLRNVYYCGTEDEWNNIIIEDFNDTLLNAEITYNYSEIN